MKLLRHYSHRNILNTNYKVYGIKFELPIIGNKLNNWLYKHKLSDTLYHEGYNEVIYIRRWYRKEHKWG